MAALVGTKESRHLRAGGSEQANVAFRFAHRDRVGDALARRSRVPFSGRDGGVQDEPGELRADALVPGPPGEQGPGPRVVVLDDGQPH
jgi:hypothetical protein